MTIPTYRVCWKNLSSNEVTRGLRAYSKLEAQGWVFHLNLQWNGLFRHWIEEIKS